MLAIVITSYLAACSSGGHDNLLKTKGKTKKSRKTRVKKKTKQDSTNAIEKKILAQAPTLDPKALKTSLLAYMHVEQQGLDKQHILSIIDYQLPSTKKSLWVINMNTDKVEYNTLVAHGRNSGDNYATKFSNRLGSDESSLGVYLTANTYHGKHGYSLRLRGLEAGFNSNAYRRAVVMHSAWYVSQGFADKYGHLGRSWGCTALNKKIEPKIVKAIKDGSVLVAYYPEKKWLQQSAYLKPLSQNQTATA